MQSVATYPFVSLFSRCGDTRLRVGCVAMLSTFDQAMSTENNKALIRRYVDEVWNKGDFATLRTCFDARLADYNGEWVAMWRTALPDVHVWVDAMIAEDDYVAVHMTLRGTHLGELKGEPLRGVTALLPPTGHRLEVAALVVYAIVDDKIVHVPFEVMDWLTMLRQLGAALDL